MDPSRMSDAELVSAYLRCLPRSAPEELEQELVSRLDAGILPIVRRMRHVLPAVLSEEDAAQMARIAALRKLNLMKSNLRAWAGRVTLNLLIDLLRATSSNDLDAAERLEPESTDELADARAADPVQTASHKELLERLRGAIEKLPPSYRLIVTNYINSIPLSETAAMLHVSDRVARQRRQRAFEMLRRKLSP